MFLLYRFFLIILKFDLRAVLIYTFYNDVAKMSFVKLINDAWNWYMIRYNTFVFRFIFIAPSFEYLEIIKTVLNQDLVSNELVFSKFSLNEIII